MTNSNRTIFLNSRVTEPQFGRLLLEIYRIVVFIYLIVISVIRMAIYTKNSAVGQNQIGLL